MARLSIGLPVFNGARFLSDALDSLLGQTFSDFELVIGDNASTDATERICREYASRDARIRYYRHERNIGGAANFNFVLSQARAEYFKWAAHDDAYDPTFLEKCIAVLDRAPSVLLCSTRTALMDEDGRRLTESEIARGYYIDKSGNVIDLGQLLDPPRRLDSASRLERFREYNLKTIAGDDIYGVMRTDVLRRTAGYGKHFGGDSPILAELCLIGPLVQLPEALFIRRCHRGQSVYQRSLIANWRWATGGAGRLPVPAFALTRARMHSVWRVELPWHERAYCLGVVSWWFLRANIRDRLFGHPARVAGTGRAVGGRARPASPGAGPQAV
jgi:glycosyltransferase involved in cell wall biosynthesis